MWDSPRFLTRILSQSISLGSLCLHPSICRYLDSSFDAHLLQFPESVRSGNQICGRPCITYLSFSDFHLHLSKNNKVCGMECAWQGLASKACTRLSAYKTSFAIEAKKLTWQAIDAR
ncbi:hypothetical protein BO83DRAFT_239428 [Aspergillus eucalypticola CBS 122712]|uniref:Uncharacterized protein n=1 Tax=Aspergillus eucalypticola (strain CBS 122712 / IBT 29274) TaxID=1448314 RepID=A0A317VT89_ASPEC|nr:uncharacterized protein BO83DRAFT_239428 [Aspergillus eucalypticola CBS 122712]PWY76779.1 hypothetical protein BO83DRAFT_239428 [Aspergillus eucalypticola CBS 122712]